MLTFQPALVTGSVAEMREEKLWEVCVWNTLPSSSVSIGVFIAVRVSLDLVTSVHSFTRPGGRIWHWSGLPLLASGQANDQRD